MTLKCHLGTYQNDEIGDLTLALVSKGPFTRLHKKGQVGQPPAPVYLNHSSAELWSHTPLYLLTLTEGLGPREHSLEYLPLCI